MGLLPPTMNADQLMNEAKELMAKKDTIEAELKELEDVLVSSGVGMNEALVDQQGFPRAEIDIHSIRTSRNLIIRLRNDHKQVMKDIERVLHEIHKASRDNQPTSQPVIQSRQQQQQQPQIPFAIVNAVAPDSPAATSGLKRNDRIVQFGHIDANNHQHLSALNSLISQNENNAVPITLLRDGQTLNLTVTPRSGWGGRGTLGCHLLPL